MLWVMEAVASSFNGSLKKKSGHAAQRNPIRSAPWEVSALSLADVSWMRS